MNILHHKSYHVYNRKNIERVQKDEAEAEAKAKVDQERVKLAESEARLNLLRQRANARLQNQDSTQTVEPMQHIDLFKDLVEKGSNTGNNEEHEAEEKEKDDKWNKQITMYLDKDTKKEDDPWYAKKETGEEKYIDKDKFKRREDKDSNRRKRDPIKLLDDPLDLINSHKKKKEKKKYERERKYYKEVKEKKSKSKSSSSASSSMEELRAKRLERERNEKLRVKRLYLGPNMTEEMDKEGEEELDDRKRGYNSQFNREETSEAKSKKKRRY